MMRRWFRGCTAPNDGRPFLAGSYGGKPVLAVWDKDESRFRSVEALCDADGGLIWPDVTNIHLWAEVTSSGETVPFGIDDDGDAKYVPKSDMGEPYFTLLARDPFMPALVQAWAYLRTGQTGMAELSLASALSCAVMFDPQLSGDEQIVSAFRVAEKARSFQAETTIHRRHHSVSDPSNTHIKP